MKRFVNSHSKTYHHSAIEDFSDKNKFLTSGLAKGYNTREYSWVADMIFKNTGNLSLNPNVGYISFFSDREIMYQEFANVSSIQDAYPFFSSWEREILSDLTFELDTKQYFKIGQRYAEFDLIEYVNPSEFITEPTDGYRAPHQFYRAPVFHAEGYKLNMDDDLYESYDKYIWAVRNTPLTTFSVGEYFIELILFSGSKAIELSIDNYAIYSGHSGALERVLDYKIHADNPKYAYFDSGIEEWVSYYNETNHYQTGSYYPYIGTVAIYYGESWLEKLPDSNCYLFPEIIIDGVLEPAKVITKWQDETSAPKGRMVFNSGNHLDDSKDQSRIVYSICKYMINEDMILGNYFIRREFDVSSVLCGIDVDTERNRRYSAVVMTEPYFTTVPMGSGQLVEYSFVDENGDETISGNEKKYLKIRAPLNILSEVDGELNSNDYNTDIINVLTINDINPNGTELPQTGGSNFYIEFQDPIDSTVFYERQDCCLDDLVGGIVGVSNHRVFWMTPFGVDATKYSDGKMKVCGLGITWDGYGSSSRMNLNIYCTNYEAINSPAPSVVETPIANDYTEFLTDTSNVDVYSGSEKFKPMIKLPGMNGYVKIMKKNISFPVTRASDGKYEVVYNIEFPYCPGSANVRGEDFGVISGFIYKKKSYINAGSQEADATNDRYDAGNDRYTPYGDDSFSKVEILLNPTSSSGFITTDPFGKGGGMDTPLKSVVKKQINYPCSLVWMIDNQYTNLFSLTKSRFADFKRYGTYEINFSIEPTSEDMKLFCLVDNRQWKFNENRFASYIGRENPAYVFEIDTSILFEDFTKFQAFHGSIPDTKRWLYGYFTGFAHTLLSQDTDDINVSTEKSGTIGNNYDILSSESKSDITIEIWDQDSLLGMDGLDEIRGGNWRPFISLSSDNHKIPGPIIVDNIFISNVAGVPEDNPIPEFDDGSQYICSAYIGYMESEESGIISFIFPESIVSDSSGIDVLDGKSNLVLYDKDDNISLHIAYIKRVNDPLYLGGSSPQQVYKVYVKSDSGIGIFKTINVEDISDSDVPQYQIRLPFKTITKNPRFSIPTIRAVDGIADGFLTKYLDIRGDSDSPSDYERFILDNKVRFRIRPVRAKKYPSSYIDKDNNEIPYVGSGVGDDDDANRDWLNFPWYDSLGVIEDAFNWAKVKTEETVRKFGLNYFKCASK